MTMTLERPDHSPGRRPTGVNGWLVIGGIFTLLVVVLGALGVAGWLGFRTEIQTQVYQTAITDLDIDLTTGDLRVAVGGEGAVTVTRRLHWSFTKPTFQENFDGQRLSVTQSCGSVFMPGPGCGVDYTVQVPAGTSLRAHTDTGDIEVNDIRGPVDVGTSTGDVSISGVVGDLSVRTGTGDITVVGARSPHVDASTSTGDIELRLADSPQTVTANTGTGDVDVTVPQGEVYHVQTETSTGDSSVGVHTSDTAPRTIKVHTSTGDIGIAYA